MKASCPRAAELPPINFYRNVCFDLLKIQKLLTILVKFWRVFCFCLGLTVNRSKCLCVMCVCVRERAECLRLSHKMKVLNENWSH